MNFCQIGNRLFFSLSVYLLLNRRELADPPPLSCYKTNVELKGRERIYLGH